LLDTWLPSYLPRLSCLATITKSSEIWIFQTAVSGHMNHWIMNDFRLGTYESLDYEWLLRLRYMQDFLGKERCFVNGFYLNSNFNTENVLLIWTAIKRCNKRSWFIEKKNRSEGVLYILKICDYIFRHFLVSTKWKKTLKRKTQISYEHGMHILYFRTAHIDCEMHILCRILR
jgi:hypothetical protein